MKNLCDTCSLNLPNCGATRIVFGIDKDPQAKGEEADVVLECNSFKEIQSSSQIQGVKV